MPFQRYTRTQLVALLQDKYEAAPFWTTEDAQLGINRALKLWNALTGYWRTSVTVLTTPNDPLVPLTGTLAQGTAVSVGGLPLVPTALVDLSYQRPSWWTERTTSGGAVPTRATVWTPVGLTLLAIWPATATQVSLLVDGVRTTPVLTTDGQFVDIGDEVFSTLLGYALHDAAFKAGPVVLQRTLPYLRAFLREAAVRNARFAASNAYKKFERQFWQKALQPTAIPVVEAIDAQVAGGVGS